MSSKDLKKSSLDVSLTDAMIALGNSVLLPFKNSIGHFLKMRNACKRKEKLARVDGIPRAPAHVNLPLHLFVYSCTLGFNRIAARSIQPRIDLTA